MSDDTATTTLIQPVTPPASPPARNVTASSATLLVTMVLLGMAFFITMKVLSLAGVSPVLVTAIVTAWITLPLGGATGFWLGSSVGGRAN